MNAAETLADLSGKRALAATPAIKTQDLYYSALNSTGSLVESSTNYGRLQISLSQSGWGQSAQVTIPASSFNDGVYLRLVLPNLAANVILSRGWGYQAISNLQWTFGSSNIGSINLGRSGLIAQVLSECDTEERASDMWLNAGAETIGPTTVQPSALVFVPFPWSSYCGGHPKKGFDTNLLQHSSPITFILTFSQPSEIFGGSGFAAGLAPASFSAAQVLFIQTELADRSQGLSEVLRKEPELVSSYPFVHRQLFAPNAFTGSTNPSAPVTAVLQSFINADLLAISFVVLPIAQLSSTAGSVSSWTPSAIQNMVMTYNGIVMYNAPEFGYRMYNARGVPGAGGFKQSAISTGAFGFPPYAVGEIMNFLPIYSGAMTGRQVVCKPDHMGNVARYTNQQLSLSFTTPDTSNYILQVVYHYAATVEVSSQGNVSIIF
jgi:hypothetical protein